MACSFRLGSAGRFERRTTGNGREVFTGRLIRAVQEHNLVAVVGASGSGKSSVVRAGLIPYLRRTTQPGTWEIATFVPGREPLRSLVSVLMPLLEPESTETDRLAETAKLHKHLESGLIRLADVTQRVLEKQRGSDRLLLVVDQWEEIYTEADDAARDRFVEVIVETARGGEGKTTIVMTLRGDFVDRALSVRELAERLQGVTVFLGPMTEQELQEAVALPAERVGLQFESGLKERLLTDVGAEPGSLPLLEFVLTELWEKRREGRLLHEAYDGMGGLKGALANKAEEILGRMGDPAKNWTRKLLLQLVHTGERSESTRRRASFDELGEAVVPLARLLAQERLLVTGFDEASGEETAELAHETLIRNWPQLQKWIDEDREFLLWRQRLRAHQTEWEEKGRDEGALLRGAVLGEAQSKLASRSLELTDEERGFISESARIERARRLSTRALSMAKSFALFTASLVVSGFIAEKTYRSFLNVRLDVTWNEAAATGISILANLVVGSIPLLVALAAIALVSFAILPLSRRFHSLRRVGWHAADALTGKGVLFVVQLGALLALLFALIAVPDALFLGTMLGSSSLSEKLLAVEQGSRQYETLTTLTLGALLVLWATEAWRRRLYTAQPSPSSAADIGTKLVSLGSFTVASSLVVLLSMAHGFVHLPQHRIHELVLASFSNEVKYGELEGKTLELIQLRADAGGRTLYCAADERSWDRVAEGKVVIIGAGSLLNLARAQIERGACESR